MPDKSLKVGIAQSRPALFDLAKGIDICLDWIEEARAAGIDFLLFPESFLPGYPRGLSFDAQIGSRSGLSREQWKIYWDHSLEIDSPDFQKIQAGIQKAGIYVSLGITEKSSLGGTLFCSQLLFNPKGQLLGIRRKLKPTGLERYCWGEGNGKDLRVHSTDIGKIGALICWENYMPLARMAMYQQGIELYLAPTADARPSWQASLLHIALEGRCFVLGANQVVQKKDYPPEFRSLWADKEDSDILCSGGSVIISPLGEVLAGPLWNQEGLLVAELNFSDLVKSKLDFDPIGHYARPDVLKFQYNPEEDPLKTK